MAFPFRLPEAQEMAEDDLHQDAGPGMVWSSATDVDFDLRFNQSFDLSDRNDGFHFQIDPADSNFEPFSFPSFNRTPISQTGPPFKAKPTQVSDIRHFSTDNPVPGRKKPENNAVSRTSERSPDARQFGANMLGAMPDLLDTFQYGSGSGRQAYQEFMPMPVTTPSRISTQQVENKTDGLFGLKEQVFAKPRQQTVPRRPSRKRPRHRPSSQNPRMGGPTEIPSEIPGLSSTTSTLDSTMDEVVNSHALSVIENWLHEFSTVLIPTDDDFQALATLTRLKVQTVRIWFGQRLRREPTKPIVATLRSVPREALPSTTVSAVPPISSNCTATQSTTQVPIPVAQQAILREAARWVRERGTKCVTSPDATLLSRYGPRPYQCTLKCGKTFDKRADWQKHEKINYPQEGWVCKESSCVNKSMSDLGKISYRKDKFTQHFANTHPGANPAVHCDTSHFLVASRFPRRCGFCIGHRFCNWQDRINHIGDHFSVDRYDMTRWQVPADDVVDEVDQDGQASDDDDDDKEFDGDKDNHFGRSGNDFDWDDHDYHDDAFSDFSEDDSDDSPPGSAPKQRAHTGHEENLTVLSPMRPLFIDQSNVLVHRIREQGPEHSRHTTTSLEHQRSPRDSEQLKSENKPTLLREYEQALRSLSQDRFTRIRVLGIGPYSVVDEVQDRKTGCTFARKTVHYTTPRTFKALKLEVEIMKKLEHPHIVRFVGDYTADHSLSILMTPSADFDLAYLLGTDVNVIDTQTVAQWFRCLVSSVDYLHSHSIKHQDIKPSNILIRGNTVFLADFGVAKTFNELDSTSSTSGNMTRKYCSPETALNGLRGRKSDVFALGCVFLEMVSFLLQDDDASFQDYQWKHFVGEGGYHENLPQIEKWLDCLSRTDTRRIPRLNLIQVIESCMRMLEMEPCDRPTAKELTAQFTPRDCCEALLPIQPNQGTLRRHSDLKPENILWSNEMKGGICNIFEVANSNSGDVHSIQSSSHENPKNINELPNYTPSEVSLDGKNYRAYDIWTLSCVSLESVIWLLCGSAVMKIFAGTKIEAVPQTIKTNTACYSKAVNAMARPELQIGLEQHVSNDRACQKPEEVRNDSQKRTQTRTVKFLDSTTLDDRQPDVVKRWGLRLLFCILVFVCVLYDSFDFYTTSQPALPLKGRHQRLSQSAIVDYEAWNLGPIFLVFLAVFGNCLLNSPIRLCYGLSLVAVYLKITVIIIALLWGDLTYSVPSITPESRHTARPDSLILEVKTHSVDESSSTLWQGIPFVDTLVTCVLPQLVIWTLVLMVLLISITTTRLVPMKRNLSLAHISFIVLSGIIGVGLFIVSGRLLERGLPICILAVYLTAGIITIGIIGAIAEMVSMPFGIYRRFKIFGRSKKDGPLTVYDEMALRIRENQTYAWNELGFLSFQLWYGSLMMAGFWRRLSRSTKSVSNKAKTTRSRYRPSIRHVCFAPCLISLATLAAVICMFLGNLSQTRYESDVAAQCSPSVAITKGNSSVWKNQQSRLPIDWDSDRPIFSGLKVGSVDGRLVVMLNHQTPLKYDPSSRNPPMLKPWSSGDSLESSVDSQINMGVENFESKDEVGNLISDIISDRLSSPAAILAAASNQQLISSIANGKPSSIMARSDGEPTTLQSTPTSNARLFTVALPTPTSSDSKLVYLASKSTICIRTYSGACSTDLQCITHPAEVAPELHSPLEILDGLGGTSLYYISRTPRLYGLDSILESNTWGSYNSNTKKPLPSVHPQSQLAAVTWFDGTSSWLYYQDETGQLREYEIDDYLDTTGREGATGPLVIALEGTGIRLTRYLPNDSEVLEVFIQTDNDVIHGRVYQYSVWEADFYSVEYKATALFPTDALTATMAHQQPVDVILVWMDFRNILAASAQKIEAV